MTFNPTWTTVTLIFLSNNFLTIVNAGHYEDNAGLHSIERGTRKMVLGKPVDLLLFHDNVKVDGKLFPFPRVTSHDLCYPPKGSKLAKFTITAFNVNDQGKGGLAFIKKGGGVGKNKLCLHFKSRRGRGYQFNIDIWGYYN